MIREIGSFKFPGFYESLFCNSDEFIDYEAEDQFRIDELVDNAEIIYEYEDFNKYKIDVCEAFMENYIDKIIEVLPNDIVEYEDFKFEKDSDVSVFSPEYYNYETDRCFCNIKTNRKTLKLIKEYTLRLTGVQEYIVNHFTSCDGFISFISNNIEYWKSLDIEDYEENMLIALLDMLISLSDDRAFEEITFATYYDVDKFSYIIPTVYYNGNEEGIKILKENGFCTIKRNNEY